MPDPVRVSAVVCTHERGPDIELTIDSLLAQGLPAGEFEIVLVDNGSSPANAAILRRAAASNPTRVRYVREDVLGESSARNCALRETTSELIAFLDDDAVAAPGWLGAFVAAFDRDPGLGVVGGRVDLRYLAPPPPWLDASLVPYLSAFDQGDERRELTFMDYPRGASMAFRRAVFADAGLFSQRFGRKGKCLLSCSEIEMCYRIERAGWRIEYLPEARIDHIVPAERLQESWFARRIYWQGRSLALLELTHFGRLHVLRRTLGQLLALLRKSRLHRGLHVGYLAGVPRHFFANLRDAQPTASR
jgi:GT2 family glycosyltransferase